MHSGNLNDQCVFVYYIQHNKHGLIIKKSSSLSIPIIQASEASGKP